MKHFYLLLFLIGGLMTETADAQQFYYTPPDNFVADTSIVGANTWFNKSAGSVIQISETKGSSFLDFKNSFSEKQLTDNNLVIKEKRTVSATPEKSAIKDALVYICSFRTVSADGNQDVEFTRIVFFCGNTNTMVMAVATIPAMAEPVLLEPLIQSFEKDIVIH